MRALIQRVAYGSVRVGGELIAEIHKGLVILLGIGRGDGEEQTSFLVIVSRLVSSKAPGQGTHFG